MRGYRSTNDSAIAAIVGLVLFIGWFGFCLSLVALKVWVIGSLVTSGVKAAKDDCGQTYSVESVLSGNWFCPNVPESHSDNADKPAPVTGAY